MPIRLESCYLTVHGGKVARTVEIHPHLHVDLTTDGRVVGVERVGAVVTVEDLAVLLFSLPFDTEEDTDR